MTGRKLAPICRVLGIGRATAYRVAPRRPEYATGATGAPAALARNALVHTGRPPQRANLSAEDGAILEILRERAQSSDLSPEQTAQRLLRLLQDEERYRRLVRMAQTE